MNDERKKRPYEKQKYGVLARYNGEDEHKHFSVAEIMLSKRSGQTTKFSDYKMQNFSMLLDAVSCNMQQSVKFPVILPINHSQNEQKHCEQTIVWYSDYIVVRI